jgi:hypothetical protein
MTTRAVATVPVLPGLAEAQLLIEAHLRCDVGGRCVTCGQLAPCHLRALAHAAFVARGALPLRRNGIDRSPVGSAFTAFGT